MSDATLLGRAVKAVNVGADLFVGELERQGVPVTRVAWQPPVPGSGPALNRMALHSGRIAAANDAAVSRLQEAQPLLVGVGRAADLLPDMDDRTILHAGPAIEWHDMSGPLRGAIVGAAMYEGLAADPEDAGRRAVGGEFRFAPCHERGAVGPMAGVVSASMPMWVVENEARGNRSYATLNEGLGKVLRYGGFDAEVLDRLRWIRDVLAPAMGAAVARLEAPIDLRRLITQALMMGDECHNRNRAATSLFLGDILSGLLSADLPSSSTSAVARFVSGNDHFFLNLSMAACKATADAAAGAPGSSLLTAMARNGTEFGIRVAGTGDRWFTGPAGKPEGLYWPGFGPEDAALDIGDSAITETAGLGGFAMAAAPAIVGFVGGTPQEAIRVTERMYDITWAESASYRIPALAFRGTPLGIDCREVVHTGTLPVINTGIAHREAGVGQIGAGLVHPPVEAFVAAVDALSAELDRDGEA